MWPSVCVPCISGSHLSRHSAASAIQNSLPCDRFLLQSLHMAGRDFTQVCILDAEAVPRSVSLARNSGCPCVGAQHSAVVMARCAPGACPCANIDALAKLFLLYGGSVRQWSSTCCPSWVPCQPTSTQHSRCTAERVALRTTATTATVLLCLCSNWLASIADREMPKLPYNSPCSTMSLRHSCGWRAFAAPRDPQLNPRGR